MSYPGVTGEDYLDLARLMSVAALDPGAWGAVIGKMSAMCGDINTHMFGFDMVAGHSEACHVTHGYDPEFMRLYDTHYYQINEWAPGFSEAEAGTVLASQQMRAEEEIRKTEFYADWVQPQENIIAGGGAVLLKDPTRAFLIGGNIRAGDSERLQPVWLDLVARCVPLLQYALEINRTLAGLRLEAHLLRQDIDPDGALVLVLNVDGRIVNLDAAAARMIEASQLIALSANGVCSLTDAVAMAQIEGMIALHRRSGRNPTQPVTVRHGDRRFRCHVVFLDGETEQTLRYGQSFFALPPLTVLVMKPYTSRPELPDDMLKRIAAALGITAGEANVANLLAQELTPAEIAERCAKSLHTVRNQIKSALSKSGCRRQSELVARVVKLQEWR